MTHSQIKHHYGLEASTTENKWIKYLKYKNDMTFPGGKKKQNLITDISRISMTVGSKQYITV